MAIAIRCPNCGKSYNLKDHLKGKRVACTNPNCKKVFSVDAPVTVSTAAKSSSTPPANVDELALAALFDETKTRETQQEPEAAPVRVKCQFCDHESVFEARMAGKNAPCQNEECRKIIKVPLPTKEAAKDWRTVAKRPSAARTDTEQLEGAWGNMQAQAVSRDAILEAEADRIEEVEPRSWRQIIKIGLVAAAVVVFLVIGVVWYLRRHKEGRQERAIQLALEYVKTDPKKKQPPKLKKEQAGLIRLLAGQYELIKDKPAEAKIHLVEARSGVEPLGNTSPERCAALIEVACALAELAGRKEQIAQGSRFDWDDKQHKPNAEVRASLGKLPTTGGEEQRDMRAHTFRKLARILGASGNAPAAAALANNVVPADDRSEILAVIGLELLAMGQRDEAEKIASQASAGQPANAPSVVALWLAIAAPDAPRDKHQRALDQAHKFAPEPSKEIPLTPVMQIGYAEGWARQGKIDKARDLAWKVGKPEDRLRAAAAVAAVVLQTRPGETTDVEQCAKLIETELKGRQVSSWLVLRLVQLSSAAGKPELANRFTAAVADPGLKAWSQFEALRGQLKAQGNQPASRDLAAAVGDPDKLAHWLAWAELARHNASAAGSGTVLKEVKTWDSDAQKAFGYAGVALAER